MTERDQDPLLRALGELERDEYERPYPAQWEAVLAGRTSPAEAAAARADEDPPELQAAYAEAFPGPLSAAEIEAMSDRVTKTLGLAGAEVVRPRFGRKLVIGAVAALAAAAALVLWQIPREPPRPSLMAYSLTVRSPGMQAQRSGDVLDDRYAPDSTIDWILSPELATAEKPELRVLARDEAGAVRLLAPSATRSPEGVLRLRGPFVELGLSPGRWQLRFVVCADAPTSTAAIESALTTRRCVEAKERLDVTALPASH